jgi:hypothetical protein
MHCKTPLFTNVLFNILVVNMAAAVIVECMGAVTKFECSKVSGSCPCLCGVAEGYK